MTPRELTEASSRVEAIARRAGALLRQGQRQGFTVENKSAVELVTEHDRRAEALIVAALEAAFPAHRIVGEEGSLLEGGDSHAVWYVDPLDGTTNFAHGIPFYAVSIGLEIEEEPALGVVYAPDNDWMFVAAKGQGAFLNGQPLRVSSATGLAQALLATGFPYDRTHPEVNNLAEFGEVFLRSQGIRRMGVASLDCAMVAWGVLDGYWELQIKPWDVSAGALLVREAGGCVTDTTGGPFRSTAGRILATNGIIHQELRDVLAKARCV
jgi:myo-inositol-1(or 4)-monophosphatase